MRALIFGITGQDGYYLAKHLLELGYEVVGIHRRCSTTNLQRLESIKDQITLFEGDITDFSSVFNIVNFYDPDEIYNLAAQSHVATSFNQPSHTFQVNTIGCLNILESIRLGLSNARFYQASSSEMFGSQFDLINKTKYQDENTKMEPQSPYGISKLASHNLVNIYRNGYGLFVCSGILFNHESPKRGDQFVTKKVTNWLKEFIKWKKEYTINGAITVFDPDFIYAGKNNSVKFPKLRLGNLHSKRDFGHSADYVRAMHMMLNQEQPKDYVIASGETHSIKEFVDIAFKYCGLKDYTRYTVIDSKLYRPLEVDYLLGDCSKAKEELGWKPKYSFKELVLEMVKN